MRATAHGSQVTTLELRDAARAGRRARLARAYVLQGRIVWSPDARFILVERPLLRSWMLVDVRTRRSRHIELPRALRLASGGVVDWIP